MERLKKYKTQIFNVITIFLILEFAIFPGLTSANTIMNILAGIALLLLVLWGGLALYDYVRNTGESKQLSDEEIKQKLESELGPVIDEMAKEVLAKPKRKSNPKQSTTKGTDKSAPVVKTRKKSTTKTK